MDEYNHHSSDDHVTEPLNAAAIVVARVSETERAGIAHLARIHDRTPSREVRRAIRFYLTHFELADRALRDEATRGLDRDGQESR